MIQLTSSKERRDLLEVENLYFFERISRMSVLSKSINGSPERRLQVIKIIAGRCHAKHARGCGSASYTPR